LGLAASCPFFFTKKYPGTALLWICSLFSLPPLQCLSKIGGGEKRGERDGKTEDQPDASDSKAKEGSKTAGL
jgi:hypothetical protein